MRIRTVGLAIAGAAAAAAIAGGVAYAQGDDAEPSVRIVQQEQPTQPDQQPSPTKDCPRGSGGGTGAQQPSTESL
jgi:hypothetical protein